MQFVAVRWSEQNGGVYPVLAPVLVPDLPSQPPIQYIKYDMNPRGRSAVRSCGVQNGIKKCHYIKINTATNPPGCRDTIILHQGIIS